jgi:membrane-associated phospholipid phosphatase
VCLRFAASYPVGDDRLCGVARRALVWVLVLALAGFVALALGYDDAPLATIDEEIATWAFEDMPTFLEWVARPLSWIGGVIGLVVVGVVAGALLVRERAWLDLGFFLAAFAGSQLVVQLLKVLVDRARPDLGSVVELPASAAFPSGHATAGVASLGALVVLVSERLPSRRARVWLWSLAVVLALAIGLSRIALGVHFATDVVAGWCLGLAWLAACLLVRDALRTRDMVAAPSGSTH